MKELELIRLYFYLCDCNDNYIAPYCQRFSNNRTPPNQKLTDIELLTIYFYVRRHENKHLKSEIYDYAERYLLSWFPDLPNYQNFCERLNKLNSVMPILVSVLLEHLQTVDSEGVRFDVSLIDSLPIILCSGKRKGKVASELADKSYCATKRMFYYGMKLHAVAFYRKGKLPVPEYLCASSASEHDLEALRPILGRLLGREIYADKAYCDKNLDEALALNNSHIFTPIKLVKGECERIRQWKKAADDLFSTAVSKVRQPIESWFNWLIEKSGIQKASKIRSTKGLILHIFGSIASALLFLVF